MVNVSWQFSLHGPCLFSLQLRRVEVTDNARHIGDGFYSLDLAF